MNTVIISDTRGKLYFDAVLKTEHKRELTVTSHPVQYGASIVDHSYLEPDTVSLEVAYSDAMANTGEANHSVNAFTELEAIMQDREPVSLVTRFKLYDDMVITSLTVPDEYAMMNGMKAEIGLQHVNIVYARIVSVEKKVSSGKTNTKPKEEQKPKEEDELISLAAYAVREAAMLAGYEIDFNTFTLRKTTKSEGTEKTDSGQN